MLASRGGRRGVVLLKPALAVLLSMPGIVGFALASSACSMVSRRDREGAPSLKAAGQNVTSTLTDLATQSKDWLLHAVTKFLPTGFAFDKHVLPPCAPGLV